PPAPDPKDRLAAPNAKPSSPAFADQPDKGKVEGFDFFRDPLNAKKPMQTFDETMKADVADKPKVMATQKRLLERRYDLTPKLDPSAKMSRGKPLAVGPTARLASGLTWESLAAMSPEEIKRRGVFPYPALPHPKQVTGGQVFPQIQIRGVTRLDCHVNGHTTGQFHLNPDMRPQERRVRLDTVSLRGLFQQQIHGSKRSLQSVEDFTEFEQRTAYFNGDEIHAAKKGMNII